MKDIILYSLGIVWYIFCTIGFYDITTRDLHPLKIFDKIGIFILSLFWIFILGALGFAIIMVEIEYKLKRYLNVKYED